MKKLFLLCLIFLSFVVKSQDLMNLKPTGYVNDYEKIFTSEQKADLEKICSDYEKKTSIEICLVTSADFDFSYDVELANKWGVGKDGLDNGLMIILSKAQRNCSVRTGYGLEPFLPDGTLKEFTNDIFPRTLSQDKFYEGMKELVLTCQKKMGNQGYDFLVRYKAIQDEYESQMRKHFFFNVLYFTLGLIILAGIVFLIYLQYKKHKEFLSLKNEIKKIIANIDNLKNQIGILPESLNSIYNSKITKLTNKLVNENTRSKMQYIYNQLLDHKQTINTTDSAIKTIDKTKSDILNYLKDNYPYCEIYLKNELNSILPETQIEELRNGEYTKNRMNKLIGIQTSVDRRLKGFLSKTVKINNLLADNQSIDSKVEELINLHNQYLNDRSRLSTLNLGKRLLSIANVDFDKNLNTLQSSMKDSYYNLQNGNYDEAIEKYGIYITTVSVLVSTFTAVSSLFSSYNSSNNYIDKKDKVVKNLISEIESKIHKSGVSYSRKSTFEDLKQNLQKYNSTLSVDIILSAELLKKNISDFEELLRKIKSDISSHESSLSSSSYGSYSGSYSSSSSSNSSSSFGGFGGGSFGGGGVSSHF